MKDNNAMEEELLKEHLYKKRLHEVWKKYIPFPTFSSPKMDQLADSEVKIQYATEQALMNRILSNERTAFLYGIALSGLVFTSLRFGPRYLAVKIGGKEKEKALREANEISRKANTFWIQKTAAFMIEGSFSAWAGWRGYNIISQNNDTLETLSEIPLCTGRSIVSDNICTEWIHIVHTEIPSSFWRNLDEQKSNLKEERLWRSARNFADNCVKRRVFEDQYRMQHEMQDDEPVIIPEGGVPRDVLLSLHIQKNSK